MLAMKLEGAAASGAPGSRIFTKQFHGVGPCRLVVSNTGSQPLTAAVVSVGPDADTLAPLDTTTFATLAAGATAGLWIQAPVGVLAFQATSAAGTTLTVSVETAVGVN